VKTKDCSKCKDTLLIGMFTRRSDKTDGLASLCKKCDAKRRGREYKEPPVIQMTEAQCAYLAGLVDGEGYMGMANKERRSGPHKGNHLACVRMVIAITSKALYDIQAEYGFGKIYSHQPTNPKHKTRYDWTIRSNEMKLVLPQILPFLMVRNRQASLLLDYFQLPRTKNSSYRENVLAIHQQLKKLNKRGIEKSHGR
jgi:RNase P subunit RPR2